MIGLPTGLLLFVTFLLRYGHIFMDDHGGRAEGPKASTFDDVPAHTTV